MSEPTTQEINGHPVTYRAHRYECLACGARLMSIMQFQGRECSGDPAVRVHLRRGRSAEAAIHGRWHRALDDLSSEPDGPIRDHIEQHDARVRRDLAAKVEAVPSFEAYTAGGLRADVVAVNDLRTLLADALPQDADSEPASVPLAAEDVSGAAVDVPGAAGLSEAQEGDRVCSTCGQSFDSPPCCTSPFGMSGHTVAGPGPMQGETRDGGAGL